MSPRSHDLDNATPGQTVLIHTTTSNLPGTETTIERTTAQHIIVASEARGETFLRFRRKDGYEVGTTGAWTRREIIFPTDTELARARTDVAATHLAHATETALSALRQTRNTNPTALTDHAKELNALAAWAQVMARDIANGQRPRQRPATTIDKDRP